MVGISYVDLKFSLHWLGLLLSCAIGYVRPVDRLHKDMSASTHGIEHWLKNKKGEYKTIYAV